MKLVIAIGGNSLIKDKEHRTVEDQYKAVLETSQHIIKLAEAGHDIVITHGNGPQVGFILLRSEIAEKQVGLHPIPLDACGADTQGAIGYAIQRAIYNISKSKGLDKQAVTVVTQVLVDKNDTAFKNPTKPIGPFYTKEEAEEKKKLGWDIVEDAGRGFRRVVPSPLPKKIIEKEAIEDLLDKKFIVVAVGGGGIPVVENEKGELEGVAAVIDKDFASSLLAKEIKADIFIISTAVETVYLNYGTPEQKAINKMTLSEAKRYLKEGHFAKGSMEPKIKAVIEFIENGGKKASITNPENIMRAINGETGTTIIED